MRIDRRQRRAATSGTMPMPTSASTMRQTASKPLTRTRLQRRSLQRGVPCEVELQGAVVRQADEIAVDQLPEADMPPPGQYVTGGNDGDEAIAAERQRLQRIRQRGLGGDADVARTRRDQLTDVAAFAFLEVDADGGILGQEGGQEPRQVLAEGRGIRQHPHGAGEAARMHAELPLQRLDLPQDEPRMVDDTLAGRGQRHAAPVARQKGDAECLLHAADALACRGEGEVGAAGAVRDAAGFGDVKEKPQIDQIEAHGVLVAFV